MACEPGLRRSYKYKLRPTAQQAAALDLTLGLCQRLYNTALDQRRMVWRQRGVSLGYYEQKRELPALKDAEPEFREAHSTVLQDVILRCERTFARYFQRIERGERPGYPRFQGENRYHSFTYPQYGNGAELKDGWLVLSKIGRLAVRWSRPLVGTPKIVTISRAVDGWYVCFACEGVPVRPLPLTGRETGIDLGLKVFLMCADGTFIENPRAYRRAEKRLRKAHQRVSRRIPGSKRRKKAVLALRKQYHKVTRQRRDHHHKTALALVRAYDTIYYENLQIANLMRNHHLAKSISDAAWGRFCIILAAKAACAGRRAIPVSPFNTSQRCSNPDCGELVPKGLSVRWHRCPHCGTVLDRDQNAALNILRLGQQNHHTDQERR